MDNYENNDKDINAGKTKPKNIKKILIICAIIVVAITVVATVSVSAAKNYLFFPNTYEALTNALEPKLDLGTKFDVKDLLDGGKLEFTSSDIEDANFGFDDLSIAVAYNKDGVHANIKADKDELNAVLTKKGLALNSERFDDGDYYGISFSKLSEQLEDSFINPANNSDYALPKDEYRSLIKTVESLEDIADNKGKYSKDAKVILDTIKKAFNESTLSERDISYDGFTLDGNKRSARCITYTFDNDDVMDFIKCLSDRFSDPSSKLEGAVEHMLENDVFADSVKEYIGYKVSDCDGIVRMLNSISKMLKATLGKSNWKATVVFAYVKEAFSAVQAEFEFDDKTISAFIDFGEDPTKDKNIVAKISIETVGATDHKTKNSKEYTVKYGVESVESGSVVTGSYEAAEITTMNNVSRSSSDSYTVKLTFDDKKEKAIFTVGNSYSLENSLYPAENSNKEKEIFSATFGLEDRSSKLSLKFESLSLNGKKINDIIGKHTFTLYKNSGSVKMPKYENLLKMKSRALDNLFGDLFEHIAMILDNGDREDEIFIPGTYVTHINGYDTVTIKFGYDGKYTKTSFINDVTTYERGVCTVNYYTKMITFDHEGGSYRAFFRYTSKSGELRLNGQTYKKVD